MANAISRQYIIPILLPAAGTLSMSIKENYSSAVNHRLVTDLPLVYTNLCINLTCHEQHRGVITSNIHTVRHNKTRSSAVAERPRDV